LSIAVNALPSRTEGFRNQFAGYFFVDPVHAKLSYCF